VDAAKLMEITLQKHGFETITLFDEKATSVSIMTQVRVIGERKKVHRVVIYFAGHGFDNCNGYLLTHDTEIIYKFGCPLAVKAGTAVSMSLISDMIKFNEHARHILFIFNCCFSGIALQRSLSTTHQSVHFMSSCSENEKTWGEQYTVSLCDALMGSAFIELKKDKLRIEELAEYAHRCFSKVCKNPRQRPLFLSIGKWTFEFLKPPQLDEVPDCT